MKRRAIIFAAGSIGATSASIWLRPYRHASDILPPIDLEQQIPTSFAQWRIDATLAPILPDPAVQAKLDKIYNKVLARTYINDRGQRVMLSIAYGADQASDGTAVHRPEFCYSAQGFVIRPIGDEVLRLNDHAIRVRRLVGSIGTRVEPISYWITLNDQALMPGMERKLQQIKLGLQGRIPDGLLFRLSTIGIPQSESFQLQDSFAIALEAAMPQRLRPRYFGQRQA